jgi:hypothetical protein
MGLGRVLREGGCPKGVERVVEGWVGVSWRVGPERERYHSMWVFVEGVVQRYRF